jgi:hypothetical protein
MRTAKSHYCKRNHNEFRPQRSVRADSVNGWESPGRPLINGSALVDATHVNRLYLLVGAGRFERPTPCAQGRCATRLRYAPTFYVCLILNHAGARAVEPAFARLARISVAMKSRADGLPFEWRESATGERFLRLAQHRRASTRRAPAKTPLATR